MKNYDWRSEFYTLYPLKTLALAGEINTQSARDTGESLQRMNRAGQMINDLQDYHPGAKWLRSKSFADVRNGTVSLPILHVWKTLDQPDRQEFETLFGKNTLTDEE